MKIIEQFNLLMKMKNLLFTILLAFATLTVLRRIGDDLVSQIENFAEFLAREIVRVDQTSVF